MKGFTLIELMIVVAIIGILAAVAIPAYTDSVCNQDLVKCKNEMPTAYQRHLKKTLNTLEKEKTDKEKLGELVQMIAELKNSSDKKNIQNIPSIPSTPIPTGNIKSELVESAPSGVVSKQYLFKRNDEKPLTLKRHTITGELYACRGDECTKVTE